MARRIDNDIAELLNRAKPDTKPPVAVSRDESRSTATARATSYRGAPQAQGRSRQSRDADVPRGNKRQPLPQQRRSTFNIIRWLFIAAIAIVLYISNILAVRRLAVEVYQLQAQYDRMQNANSVLQAEVNRKSGRERIGSAAMQHGLVHATQKPLALDVEEEKLAEFKNR